MSFKIFFLIFPLLLFSPAVIAEAGEWGLVGDAKKRENGPYGLLYRLESNKAEQIKKENSFSGLTVRLYKSRKEMKKDNSNFMLIEFIMRISPFSDDPGMNLTDVDYPYQEVSFGLHDNFIRPTNYLGFKYMIMSPLYRQPARIYNMRGNNMLYPQRHPQINALPNRNIFRLRDSVRYAPVLIQILYDRSSRQISFYMNGILQNTVTHDSEKNRGAFSDLTLLWHSYSNAFRRKKIDVEVSYPKITMAHSKPEIKPVQPLFPGSSGDHYDTDYQKALSYLYGKNNDWEAGFKLLQRLERKDHAPAIFELACCYLRGLGCKPDRNKALKYLKKAAQAGIIEAAELWFQAADLFQLTPELQKNYAPEWYLNQRFFPQSLADINKIVRLKGNPGRYAALLNFTSEKAMQNQKKNIIDEMSLLGKTGDSYALYQYWKALNSPSGGTSILEQAARNGYSDALRELLQMSKVTMSSLSLEQRLAYACKFPLHYAGIKKSETREKTLHFLFAQSARKKEDPRFWFAYAEYLMQPYLKLDTAEVFRSEQLMKQAAVTDPLAQARFIQRYLEGSYANRMTAKYCIGRLMNSHGTEPYIRELHARYLEKEQPGRNLKLWLQLYKQRSVWAAYYLAEYALNLRKIKYVSRYRSDFLIWDRQRRINRGEYVFPELKGQTFIGFLPE